MLKIKNNGIRDENSSAQHVIKKNLNYKMSTCPGNAQSQPFLPTQFPLPHRINALLASQVPKLSTLAYQKKIEVTALHVTARIRANPS